MDVLRVEELRKVYKSKKGDVQALDNISFSVRPNEVVGLLGPNGAGKTTAIKCICGLILPISGNIYINGLDAVRDPRYTSSQISAVLEGNRNVFWRLTTKENLEFFSGLMGKIDRGRIESLIHLFGLEDKSRVQARFLSRGMQQKLAVSCALVKDTPILLLDEPTLGLDVQYAGEMEEIIRKLSMDKTILLSTHQMKMVESVCDRAIIIDKGKIIADDSISNFKKIFETIVYEVSYKGELPEDFKDKEVEEGKIKFQITDPDKLDETIQRLRARGARITSISRIRPDFEEIYLDILKDD